MFSLYLYLSHFLHCALLSQVDALGCDLSLTFVIFFLSTVLFYLTSLHQNFAAFGGFLVVFSFFFFSFLLHCFSPDPPVPSLVQICKSLVNPLILQSLRFFPTSGFHADNISSYCFLSACVYQIPFVYHLWNG